MNTQNHCPCIYHLTQSILQIAKLPNAPTFNWTSQAAEALAPLHDGATFGVIVAKMNATTNHFDIESSGVWVPQSAQHTRHDEAMCSLQRFSQSPINLPQEAKSNGYIAPVSNTFPQLAASKACIPWSPSPPNQGLVGFAPIQPANKSQVPPSHQFTMGLLIFACPNPIVQEPINLTLFSSALAALSNKASSAIGTDETKSILWLTQREQVVLDFLIQGCSVREIADNIGRSPHTIHDHVKNLHRKLKASSRGELIASALGCDSPSNSVELLKPIVDPELLNTQPYLYHNATPQLGIAEVKPAMVLNYPT